MENVKSELKACIVSRVSTEVQSYERQLSELRLVVEAHGNIVACEISEKVSGSEKMKNRSGIKELMERAKNKEFDIIYISEISRLGRTNEVLRLVEELSELGIILYVADLNIFTLDEEGETSFQASLLLNVMNLYSQSELRTLKRRIKFGIEQARRNGSVIGRRLGSTESEQKFLSKYPKVVEGLKRGFSVRECVKLFDTSLGTVAKIRSYIKEDLNQQQAA